MEGYCTKITCQPEPRLLSRSSSRAAISNTRFIHWLILATVLLAHRASGTELQAVRDQGYLNLSWPDANAKLQEAFNLKGPWQTVNTAGVSSCRIRIAGARKFYRLMLPPTNKKWLTVAAVTMHGVANTETNLAKMHARMAQAAARGADLIVFPEVALQQCPPWAEYARAPTQTEMAYMRATAETVPGPSTDKLVAKAKELGIHVVFGMTEKDAATNLYNAAVFLGPGGVLGTHRKSIHVGNDSLIWSRGTNLIQVFDSPLGKAGMMICAEMGGECGCADMVPGPRLAAAGADFLVTSSAWWSSADYLYDIATNTNALKAARWHVVAEQVGLIGYAQCYGHSRIVDPRGSVVCDSGITEGIIVWPTDILIETTAR
jgi:predicted amidohydrolase